MQFLQLFIAFVISVAATAIVVPPVRDLALSKGWVDSPDGGRKMHRTPMVTVGGVAIVVGLVSGAIYLVSISNLLPIEVTIPSPYAIAGGVVIVAMGLIDDVRHLSFRSKFVVQVVAAYLLVMGGYRLDPVAAIVPSIDPELGFFLAFPITMLWIVGIINAVNLVDGLDGLAAGLTSIAVASFALMYAAAGQFGLVVLTLPVLGALTGFLIHNFNPATIFMGNSGSYLLGYLLALVSIQAPMHEDPAVSVMIVLVILGLPVLDTCHAFLRRYLRGVSPFTADSDHIHHRLVRIFCHRRAVIIMYVSGVGLGAAGVIMANSAPLVATCVFAGTVIVSVAAVRILGYVPVAVRRRVSVPTNGSGNDLSHTSAASTETQVNGQEPSLMRPIRTAAGSS